VLFRSGWLIGTVASLLFVRSGIWKQKKA